MHVLFDVVIPPPWNGIGSFCKIIDWVDARVKTTFSLKIIPLHFHSTITNSSGIEYSVFLYIYKRRRHERDREGLTNTSLDILLVIQNRFLIFIGTATVTNNSISNNKKNYVHVGDLDE